MLAQPALSAAGNSHFFTFYCAHYMLCAGGVWTFIGVRGVCRGHTRLRHH